MNMPASRLSPYYQVYEEQLRRLHSLIAAGQGAVV